LPLLFGAAAVAAVAADSDAPFLACGASAVAVTITVVSAKKNTQMKLWRRQRWQRRQEKLCVL